MDQHEEFSEIVGAIRGAQRVVVLTGAGVSAESGIPTFRDAMDGLWAKYDPSELATPEAFERDAATVTRWYDERRLKCLKCQPNPAHAALVRLQDLVEGRGAGFTLLTQNVDRLHQRAGSRGVVELHGSLMVWRCTETGKETVPDGEPFPRFPMPSPFAPGALLRPGVVWFGEMLPDAALEASETALGACDLFLSIGTSAVVQPAAGFVHLASRAGATTVEINRESTAISRWVDWSVMGKAGEVLPVIVDLAEGG
jgi:NAD-dependent deacetylase